MADRCGSLTTFTPVILYWGADVQFTMIRLRDGRYYVPDAWAVQYPEIGACVHVNFHYDDKLDGWVPGPALH